MVFHLVCWLYWGNKLYTLNQNSVFSTIESQLQKTIADYSNYSVNNSLL